MRQQSKSLFFTCTFTTPRRQSRVNSKRFVSASIHHQYCYFGHLISVVRIYCNFKIFFFYYFKFTAASHRNLFNSFSVLYQPHSRPGRMVSTEPIFGFSLKRWPPIYPYKKGNSQATCTAEVAPISTELLADPLPSNLVEEETNPVAYHEQATERPTTSSSESVLPPPLMNPYPITIPVSLSLGPIHPASPPSYLNAVHQVTPPSSIPSPPLLGDVYQFGVTPSFTPNTFAQSNNFQSMTSTPSAFWGPFANSNLAHSMGGSINAAATGEFPPLHSLPPSFWEPVVRQPEPDPTPPMHTPLAPSLQDLAYRADGKGENFSDDSLKAIIIKAQPHHTSQTLSHLTRPQLIQHVNDLVAWWIQANPQQANRVQQAHLNPAQQIQQQHQYQHQAQQAQQHQQTAAQARNEQRLQASGIPPLSPALQAAVDSAAAEAKAQERLIGQCPCCCEAQQNAAFSPCGHLYACTRCAHRVYDGGRGKCPVCRVPIQTYLKIYATG